MQGRRRGLAAKRRDTRQALEEHDRERIDVAPRRCQLAADLLGSEVERCADIEP
jgi:hypothetical protein